MSRPQSAISTSTQGPETWSHTLTLLIGRLSLGLYFHLVSSLWTLRYLGRGQQTTACRPDRARHLVLYIKFDGNGPANLLTNWLLCHHNERHPKPKIFRTWPCTAPWIMG